MTSHHLSPHNEPSQINPHGPFEVSEFWSTLGSYSLTSWSALGLVWFIFFGHSISITLKYHVCLASSLTSHHSIFFTLFVGFIPVTWCKFSSFFSLVPKLTKTSEKKKKKKNPEHEDRTSERRRRKKKKRTEQPTQEKKGKKKVKRCGSVLFVGPLCVFNYNIAIEL